jgi:hypothetical protein
LRKTGLERVARRVVQILGKDDCVLVGGLAVAAHGYVRATNDVDFVARIPLAEVHKRLTAHGMAAVVKRDDVLDTDFPCVKGTLDGIRVDIMPPLVPIDWDLAIELPLTKTVALRVVDLDGLLRLKLRARGPRDLMDVAALVLRHPGHRKRAQEFATAYGVADKLEAWLRDRRLQAEIAELKEAERGSEPRARHVKVPARRGGPERRGRG